jgi:hypothetical protein
MCEPEAPVETSTVKGSCLCGGVTYEIRPPFEWFQYCHCSRCRKRSGSGHAANILIAAEHLVWDSGQERVTRYELPEAKSFGTSFCSTCGSQLPRVTRNGKWAIVPAGSLDDDPGVRPERNIYWDSRAPWYVPVGEINTHAETPGGG